MKPPNKKPKFGDQKIRFPMAPKDGLPPPDTSNLKRLRFKTENGHCYVLEDRIVVTSSRATTPEQAFGMPRLPYLRVVFFLMLAVAAVALAIKGFLDSRPQVSSLALVAAVAFGYFCLRTIRKLSATVIRREAIVAVKFYGPGLGLHNTFFEVAHLEGSVARSLRITLPKTKWSGGSNTEKALRLMRSVLDNRKKTAAC